MRPVSPAAASGSGSLSAGDRQFLDVESYSQELRLTSPTTGRASPPPRAIWAQVAYSVPWTWAAVAVAADQMDFAIQQAAVVRIARDLPVAPALPSRGSTRAVCVHLTTGWSGEMRVNVVVEITRDAAGRLPVPSLA